MNTMNFPVITPRPNWLVIKTLEMHTGGEPLRIVMEGFPEVKGNSVLEHRTYIKENHDALRRALMFEPRGHADMYGVVVTSSTEGAFGVVFMHNEGYSTMCGHATIAIVRLAVEAGWVPMVSPETRLVIEAPCGLLTAYATIEHDLVTSVRFENVPSFVVGLDLRIEVEGLGEIKYDLAYGGAFYAYVKAADVGVSLTPEGYQELISVGMKIKRAIMKTVEILHPFEADLSFLYGTIFIGDPLDSAADSRNVCVFAEGEVDRSPTGSGVSARMAIHYARGEVKLKEWMTIESIVGSQFRCCVKEVVRYGGYDAVIPVVQGTAHYTGRNEFWIDPEDPFREGFILR
jgi:proline racemase